MIYIYNDFGGTHTSQLAASYHLGSLDATREPTREEILETPLFDRLNYGDRGKLYFRGADENGNSVYTVGRGRSKVLIPGMIHLVEALVRQGALTERVVMSNTSNTVPWVMSVGGLTSRWLKLRGIGEPLLVIGAKQAYREIAELVHRTKAAGTSATAPVVILDNARTGKTS